MFTRPVVATLVFCVVAAASDAVHAQDKIFKFDDDVTLLTLSPNGERLAFVARNKKNPPFAVSLVVLDLKADKPIARFDDNGSRMVFSRDGKYLISSQDGYDHQAKTWSSTLALWGIESGKQEHSIQMKGLCIGLTDKFHFARDPSGNKSIIATDLENGKVVEFKCPPPLKKVTASPDDKYVVTVAETTVKVWELASGKELFAVDTLTMSQITFFSKDNLIAIGARLFELPSGKHVGGLYKTGMAFSPDRKYMATFGKESFLDRKKLEMRFYPEGIQIISIAKKDVIATIESKNEWRVDNLFFTADGRYLVGVPSRGMIRFWDLSKVIPAME